MGIPTSKSMVCGFAIGANEVYLGEHLDYAVREGIQVSYVGRFDPKNLGTGDPWRSRTYEGWTVVSGTAFASSKLNFRCILSREGQVRLYGQGGNPDQTFQIPEAGVFNASANGLGYVNRIRAVGGDLLVCGTSRQVYRLDWDGHDLASGHWVDVAGPMRQPPMPEPPEDSDEEVMEGWMDENEAIDFVDIAGASERDVYAAGDEVWHWNGRAWSQLTLPTDEPVAAIRCWTSIAWSWLDTTAHCFSETPATVSLTFPVSTTTRI